MASKPVFSPRTPAAWRLTAMAEMGIPLAWAARATPPNMVGFPAAGDTGDADRSAPVSADAAHDVTLDGIKAGAADGRLDHLGARAARLLAAGRSLPPRIEAVFTLEGQLRGVGGGARTALAPPGVVDDPLAAIEQAGGGAVHEHRGEFGGVAPTEVHGHQLADRGDQLALVPDVQPVSQRPLNGVEQVHRLIHRLIHRQLGGQRCRALRPPDGSAPIPRGRPGTPRLRVPSAPDEASGASERSLSGRDLVAAARRKSPPAMPGACAANSATASSIWRLRVLHRLP